MNNYYFDFLFVIGNFEKKLVILIGWESGFGFMGVGRKEFRGL